MRQESGVSRGLITLETWAQRHYAECTPHVQTLRKWVREGKIRPLPEKHGRAYYVQPDAEYTSDESLVKRLTHAATQAQQRT
jgi:predicted site-specific integrase-resolvase